MRRRSASPTQGRCHGRCQRRLLSKAIRIVSRWRLSGKRSDIEMNDFGWHHPTCNNQAAGQGVIENLRIAPSAAHSRVLAAFGAFCASLALLFLLLPYKPVSAQGSIEVGGLETDVVYQGQPPSATGAACDFNHTLDGYGFLGDLCDSQVQNNIPVGQYTLHLGYGFGSGDLVPAVPVTIVAGQTTKVEFDVSSAVGIVTGKVLINGQPVGDGTGVCGSTNGQVCTGLPSGDGSFKLLLPAGAGTGTVWANSCQCNVIGNFKFTVGAGQSTDVGTVDVAQGNLETDVVYQGQPPSATGAACDFNHTLDGFGFLGDLCDSQVQNNIPVGQYTLHLGYGFGSGDLVPAVPVTIVAGQTTKVEFDVSSAVGIVTGKVLINGQPVGDGTGVCGSTNGQVCTGLPSGDGSFKLLLPAGAGTGTVWANSCQCNVIGNFNFSIVAGQTTDAGNPLANHPPQVTSGGPYTLSEGGQITLTATGSDQDGDALTYAWDLDNNGSFETPGQSVAFSAANLDGPSVHTATVQVTDSAGLTATAQALINVLNVPPAVGPITAPVDPIQVGAAISASDRFTDPGTLDTHKAVWDWGDGTTAAGTVNETNGSGNVTGSHTYTTSGVYTLKLIVTDKDGGAGQSAFQYVVVYDPSAGFVTGSGWINSPTGAYSANPSLVGRASIGFNAKYKTGTTTPTGQTELDFHVANLTFASTSYQWLVISGSKAQYKGTGTINGKGSYSFILTGMDGSRSGVTDKVRIKIWDTASGTVIYDTQPGAADTADPTTPLGGGNVVIHP